MEYGSRGYLKLVHLYCDEMPWLFAIPEFVKKRACRYLLQHYLGQYLEEKIQLEDLTVDLYNGTGTITNVPLNVEVYMYTVHTLSSRPIDTGDNFLNTHGIVQCMTVMCLWTGHQRVPGGDEGTSSGGVRVPGTGDHICALECPHERQLPCGSGRSHSLRHAALQLFTRR